MTWAAQGGGKGGQALTGSCLILSPWFFFPMIPCWNQLPPELLTELSCESLGMTPLVSLLSLALPPRAFCSRNKARRGHTANMCQELQRGKLALFTSNLGVSPRVLAPAERLFICGLSFITTGCSKLRVPAVPTSEGFTKGKITSLPGCFPRWQC